MVLSGAATPSLFLPLLVFPHRRTVPLPSQCLWLPFLLSHSFSQTVHLIMSPLDSPPPLWSPFMGVFPFVCALGPLLALSLVIRQEPRLTSWCAQPGWT